MSNHKDYLKEYDMATEDEKYPLVSRWINSVERLPFFEQLRNERPVLGHTGMHSRCTFS